MTASSLGGGSTIATVAPRLEVHGLSKRYGAQIALADVDLTLAAGEIVSVVGENGAGKSTLAKIIGGAIRPDSGEITVDGQSRSLVTPRDGIQAGISYIPQELSYLPDMTVADNILVGNWPSRMGTASTGTVTRAAAEVVRRFGIDIDVRAPLSSLRLADRQLVEILKCLARDLRVLVLDEPTASLTADEAHNLFKVLRQLRSSGVGILFVSHRIDEVFEISDRIVVMRNGSVVGDLNPSQVKPRDLIELMLGSEIAQREYDLALHSDLTGGESVLSIESWSRVGVPSVRGFTAQLHRGEILGLFGQRGSGADLIADGLGGRITGFEGRLRVNGQVVRPPQTPREALSAGIVYVPPERKRDGLVLSMSVKDNLTLMLMSSMSKAGVIDRSAQRESACKWSKRLDVRHWSIEQGVDTLSGGNQQKVLLGSRLAAASGLVVLNEPTRGVDVGARAEIHNLMRHEAARGAALLLVTSDVEEAVLISNRLIVLREGRIVGQLAGESLTQAEALALATGELAEGVMG